MMNLVVLVQGAGIHEAAWRHPSTDPSVVWDPDHVARMAKLAENATFDAIFIADALTSPVGQGGDDAISRFEPLSLLSYLARCTSSIGLVATASTSFTEPFNLARQFATLDLLSKGRAGWNIVTSASDRAAENFGLRRLEDHDVRYEKAREYVTLVRALWDSWAPGSIVADRTQQRFADLSKVSEINFEGRFYKSRGPLNLPPGPQGHPALFQAGSSSVGIDLAAWCADAVFTVQHDLESARSFVRDVRSSAQRQQRTAPLPRVLPGLVPYVGSTDSEAQRLQDELEDLADVRQRLEQLGSLLGVDLVDADPDAPVPDLAGARTDSRANAIRDVARADGMTLRKLAREAGGSRGHKIIMGTPDGIADHMESWIRAGGANGFVVIPPVLPLGLELFAEQVVPVLQKRGLFRHEYTSDTLRGHLYEDVS